MSDKISKKDKWFDSLADNLERREVRSRNKYDNEGSFDNMLKIPLIGGLLYVISKYRHAKYMNRRMKNDYERTLKVRDSIKEVNLVKESIRSQINKAMLTDTVRKFEVPEKYMHEFLTVKEEFPNVIFVHQGNNEFIIVSNDSDVIF